MASLSVPSLSGEGNLSRYLQEIRKFPMLEPEEEYMLAKRWKEREDPDAAHRLVTSHLRLVAKIAMGYRGYGLPLSELISEGNVGMMQAVKRFDPDRGFRLATYAMWWIRAAIQEYILHSWSLVKMGTTAAQKKLFFNLRKLKGQLQAMEEGDLSPENLKKIATELDVPEADVVSMNRRLASPDHSLNAPLRSDSEGEWQDWLVDDSESQETKLGERQELGLRRDLLEKAMTHLNDRERHILTERRLKENPTTLEDLSQQYGISRERVRQIEVRAFEKLQKAMKAAAVERRPSRTDLASQYDKNAVPRRKPGPTSPFELWVPAFAGTGCFRLGRIQLGIPVEIVAPALVQVIGRESAAVVLQHVGRRLHRLMARIHPALLRQPIAFQQIAPGAGSHDVGPQGPPAPRARHDVIEGQVVRGMRPAAILAGEAVAQEDVKPGKGRVARGVDIFLQRDDARQPHLERRAADDRVVMVDDVDPVEEHRLDRILP